MKTPVSNHPKHPHSQHPPAETMRARFALAAFDNSKGRKPRTRRELEKFTELLGLYSDAVFAHAAKITFGQAAAAILYHQYRAAHPRTPATPKRIRLWAQRQAFDSLAVCYGYDRLCAAAGIVAGRWDAGCKTLDDFIERSKELHPQSK